jgi:hypothetical protein
MRQLVLVASFLVTAMLASCATGGGAGVAGNENGSVPANEVEAHEYQKAVNRCHRTGGTRVVKVMGELKCY